MKLLSIKIKELRKNLGFNQTNLGNLMNVEYYTIGKWEQNRAEPSADDLVKLADIFDVSVDYLLGRDDELGNVARADGPDLTPEEMDIIRKYRRLGAVEKNAVKIVVDSYSEKTTEYKPGSKKFG